MDQANQLLNQAAVAAIVVHGLDILHLPKALARPISITIAFLASAGFVLHASGSIFTGGQVLLIFPSFQVIMQALASGVVQFAMQEGYYQNVVKTSATEVVAKAQVANYLTPPLDQQLDTTLAALEKAYLDAVQKAKQANKPVNPTQP